MIEDESQHKEPDCDSEPAHGEKHQSDKCHTAPNRQEQTAKYPGWSGWYRNPEYVFSGCVAAFTLILTLTSIGQWSVMRGQLAEMGKEQRPWLLTTNDMELPVLKVGERIMWNFVYENYGKTPAIDVVQTGKVFFGKDSLKNVTDNYFGTIHTSTTDHRGTIMGPNQPKYRTLVSDEVLRESDTSITSVDGGVVLLARIEYRDTTGNDYFTEVCKYMLASGAIGNCGPHSRIK